MLCGVCWTRLALLPNPRCDRCGHPCRTSSDCAWCENLPPYVRAARSVCWMDRGPGTDAVYALKYGGWSAVAAPMALRMSRLSWPEDVVTERAAIIAVPLSRSRRRERGYNQSELLADSISRAWSIPAPHYAIARARATRTQTELTPDERRTNVAGAVRFIPQPRHRIHGGHVILVDDVLTTGATLNECARALHEGGVRMISYLTFGRARATGDRI